MKVTISKTFDFDAAHKLPNLKKPDGSPHKCSRLHGHSYEVEVICVGEPDDRGFVVDYAEIADAFAPIHAVIDHNYLNEVPGLENPSTEIVAPWILERMRRTLPCVDRVRVRESKGTWCEATAADQGALE